MTDSILDEKYNNTAFDEGVEPSDEFEEEVVIRKKIDKKPRKKAVKKEKIIKKPQEKVSAAEIEEKKQTAKELIKREFENAAVDSTVNIELNKGSSNGISFKVTEIDANDKKKEYYVNEIDFDINDNDFKRDKKYQRNINMVRRITEIAGLKVSLCNMKVFGDSDRMFVCKDASQGKRLANTNERIDKEKENTITLDDFCKKAIENWKVDVVENLFDNLTGMLALIPSVDGFDARFGGKGGNVFITENGTLDIIDLDIRQDVTLNKKNSEAFILSNSGNLLEYTLEYKNLNDKDKAFVNKLTQIFGNNVSASQNSAIYTIISLKDVLRGCVEFLSEKECIDIGDKDVDQYCVEKIAENMLKISNCIDGMYSEIENKDINTIEQNEKADLSYLRERHAHIMELFVETEIGKEANELYKEEHKGEGIKAYPETKHDLSSITSKSKPERSKKGDIEKPSGEKLGIGTTQEVGQKGSEKKGKGVKKSGKGLE